MKLWQLPKGKRKSVEKAINELSKKIAASEHDVEWAKGLVKYHTTLKKNAEASLEKICKEYNLVIANTPKGLTVFY